MVKQDRARRTRERILDAAAQEFATNGYARTTMQHVADRIDMTKGALYGQFRSKEALARALTGHGLAEFNALRARDGPLSCPLEALRRFAVGLARCVREDVRMRAAFRLQLDDAETWESSGRLLEQLVEHLLSLIGRAQQQGLLSAEHDQGDIAQMLLALAFTVQYGPFLLSGRDPAQWTDFAWQLAVRALAPEYPVRP